MGGSRDGTRGRPPPTPRWDTPPPPVALTVPAGEPPHATGDEPQRGTAGVAPPPLGGGMHAHQGTGVHQGWEGDKQVVAGGGSHTRGWAKHVGGGRTRGGLAGKKNFSQTAWTMSIHPLPRLDPTPGGG